ncbi:MAG: rhodanese-related sulfurtransferase [Burkholderiaceae bacterium]|jgi:rhodanese-related sulfurtransferase|nr:rhodanese-related sulfurtransferase [Burkholderiaceae bacterium]
MSHPPPAKDSAEIRAALLERREIALLDVREEDPHAQAHPLFAANLPLSRLELDACTRLPRRDVPIVTLDNGEGYARRAALRLLEMGYTDVAVLKNGISGWRAAGGQLFRDVNVPSKAFGELVAHTRHTPALAAEEVRALLEDAGADAIVLDVRRFDEYHTMSIPTAISVPGAELALRTPELAPRPETRVIVNCAGRTRSIIGAQSLINAGLPNPVFALRNGTIGWTLAALALDHGQNRRSGPVCEATRKTAAARAARLAERAGVKRTSLAAIAPWQNQNGRTTYFFDVREPQEYTAAHLPGFRDVPGGQLVQETEMNAPVRGARIVLFDDDGVRANMTASWLAQMDWDVHVLTLLEGSDEWRAALREHGPWQAPLPALPALAAKNLVTPATLALWLNLPPAPSATTTASASSAVVVDLTTSANYRDGHIPGAHFALRAQLAQIFPRLPKAARYVLTCKSSLLARFAHAELAARAAKSQVFVLEGGTDAWRAAGLPLERDEYHFASPPQDRYRRPYEGTDNSKEAMQAYLDWEFGLVAQLEKDGTHHFRVL